jgi:hypothetical protein
MSDHAETIKALAVELSILTGAVWTTEITTYYLDHLHTPSGESLSVEIARGRLYTSASRPANVTRGMYNAPKITTNASRPPAAIARDIQQRLLPDARDYWQKCRNEQARHDAKVQEINGIVATFGAYGLRRATWHSGGNDEESAELFGRGAKLRLYSDADIYSFEISHLTVKQAVQILEILKTTKTEEK